ncbi:hypothetical protein MA04_04152 [Alcanivorax balearicus MACL04]|uniref:Uncharacterized protein n=2 Tax=Alloalcanivorax balearicus TaxID=413232 RepID=A0ABT2R503_9GAMM|nr:hypothetical protein [Alloalcanivorax balearicus MACL04]
MTDRSIFSRYWKAYGGCKALLKSVYLRAAFILTFLFFPTWSQPGWWEDVISIMPNLLGFSLGGYAMWMAIGDDDFRALISGSEKQGKPSPYMSVNATFVHFILLQVLSIILAVMAKAYNFSMPSDFFLYEFFGLGFRFLVLGVNGVFYFVFLYALLSAIAATLALLRVSSWYDAWHKEEKGDNVNDKCQCGRKCKCSCKK